MGLSRRLVLLAALAILVAPHAHAEETRTVRVAVKNLVCPKCAGKIAKGLLAEPGIESVDSSVPEQRFTLGVKGAGPSDARLKELVEHEGVSVVSIRRD
jgi:copper chaperone CopZ